MSTLVIVTAAGAGTRLGLDVPKALVELDGAPLLAHAVRNVCASQVVDHVVVTCPAGAVDDVAALLDGDPLVDVPVVVVAGGESRQESVRAGLLAAPRDGAEAHRVPTTTRAAGDAVVDVVLVHDAARPLAPPDLVRRVVAAVRAGYPAVVPGLPVTDTVKEVGPASGDGTGEQVVATVDRARLRAVQTPQGFDRAVLLAAHEAAVDASGERGTPATDDAGLVEALGIPVHVVPGDPAAAKITTPEDLEVAGWRARSARSSSGRRDGCRAR